MENDKLLSELYEALSRDDYSQALRLLGEDPEHGPDQDFVMYMDQLIAEKKMTRTDILNRADVSVKHGMKLLNGSRHTSDRNTLLRIFIAMEITPDQANRALELYRMTPLRDENRRDRVIRCGMGRRGVGMVAQVSDWLLRLGLEPLSARSSGSE